MHRNFQQADLQVFKCLQQINKLRVKVEVKSMYLNYGSMHMFGLKWLIAVVKMGSRKKFVCVCVLKVPFFNIQSELNLYMNI